MELCKTISEIRQWLQDWDNIGFVPTMGYLHAGHLSLVKTARKETEHVVVSIYVNPSQFAPNEDLASYPRDLTRDLKLLQELNVDAIFFPDDREMYPRGFKTWIKVDKITQILCGKSRPTHFQGVTTIVSKLLNIIEPEKMFMGEKDFQQLVVLKQMAQDLNFKTEIVGCPIIREKDGLAMSSRNKFLSSQNRKNALCLYHSLQKAQEMFDEGIRDSHKIIRTMTKIIERSNCKIDYIEAVNPFTLEHQDHLQKGDRVLLAVFIDGTRLIDNREIR